jgi:hypothetical protein
VTIARWSAWVAFPVAGLIWMATRYSSTWMFGDEWAVIDRTRRPGWLGNAFDGFNGHLMIGNFVVYNVQRAWFGVEENWFVFGAFSVSLVALQLSIAGVLRRLGLPTLLALLAASVAAFFPPGNNMVSEFQMSVNFALAFCLAAAFLALSETPTPGAAAAVALLLVLGLASDSAVAYFGLAFVVILVLGLWPRRLMPLAIGVPFVAYLAWYVFGNEAVYLDATFREYATFAFHLFTLAAGGLVGGGQTKGAIASIFGRPSDFTPAIPVRGEVVGIMALVGASACTAYGLARRRLPRKVIVNLIGGLATAILATAVLTQTRTFITPPEVIPGSRFVQWPAIFLLLAFAPAITAVLRPKSLRTARVATLGVAAALIAVFVVNLSQLWPIRQFLQDWGQGTKTAVRQTVSLVNDGCGAGQRIDPSAVPTTLSPEITVGFVQDLQAERALTPGFGTRPTPEVRQVVCVNVARRGAAPTGFHR